MYVMVVYRFRISLSKYFTGELSITRQRLNGLIRNYTYTQIHRHMPLPLPRAHTYARAAMHTHRVPSTRKSLLSLPEA